MTLSTLTLVLALATSGTADAMPTPSRVDAIADAYLAAVWEERWDDMASHLTETSHYQDFTMAFFDRPPIDLHGPNAIVGFFREANAQSGTLEVRYETLKRFTAGPVVVLDMVVNVRTSGRFWGIDKDEITLRAPVITTIQVKDGKVVHHVDHCDYATAMQQVEALKVEHGAVTAQPANGS